MSWLITCNHVLRHGVSTRAMSRFAVLHRMKCMKYDSVVHGRRKVIDTGGKVQLGFGGVVSFPADPGHGPGGGQGREAP